jgi:uncharacterized protein YecE (DUF72 family)
MDVTSDFIYCRLHGSEELYASGYDNESLDQWTTRVSSWCQGKEPEGAETVMKLPKSKISPRDVYLYFDNDAKVRAPFDAQQLAHRVKTVLRT